MLALLIPDVLFYLRMSSYIWQSGQRRLLTVPHPTSARANYSSLLFFPLLGASSSLRRRLPLKLPFRD